MSGHEALRRRNAEIVERLATADEVERGGLVQELAVTNLGVARSIARRYARGSGFVPDIEQVACVALVRAAHDFDATRGHDFLAYAIPCMTGAVKRYFRDLAWSVRPPRDVQMAHTTIEDHADHVIDGVLIESCFRPRSLDAPGIGGAPPIGATIADVDDRTWDCADARLLLWPALRTLSPRAQWILHRRFVEGRTQQEIADELGVRQFHISRLLGRYLRELRERLTAA